MYYWYLRLVAKLSFNILSLTYDLNFFYVNYKLLDPTDHIIIICFKDMTCVNVQILLQIVERLYMLEEQCQISEKM